MIRYFVEPYHGKSGQQHGKSVYNAQTAYRDVIDAIATQRIKGLTVAKGQDGNLISIAGDQESFHKLCKHLSLGPSLFSDTPPQAAEAPAV